MFFKPKPFVQIKNTAYKNNLKVIVCREMEGVLFDASLKEKYEYALFPGMRACIGIIICDNKSPERKAIIHKLSGIEPESVLAFIQKNFLSKDITITTFGGNPTKDYVVTASFPSISSRSPTIKTALVPPLEKENFCARNFYLWALKNRHEVNDVLKSLEDLNWSVQHNHSDIASFDDDVYLNLQDMSLSINLSANILRDDCTLEQCENFFFNPNRVVQKESVWSFFYYFLVIGWGNIVVTDKRSWNQYAQDSISALTTNTTTVLHCSAGLILGLAGAYSAFTVYEAQGQAFRGHV